MNESVRLGRIAGIPIGMNWSVLVVAWLLTWSLAAHRLPSAHPGHSDPTYWLIGAATALLFFASLLAHELGHALVARHHGLHVERITLWLFGGVAMLRGEASTPRVELRVAVIGPVVSAALAAVFGAAALLLNGSATVDLLGAAAGWLALVNLVLAAFNMVPAAPLDGGRVLRSILWSRHGDRVRATVQAARAGRTFGFVLIGIGVIEFAAGAGLGGLWFVFLGWFLRTAAAGESSNVLLRDALAEVTVADVMTANPITAPDDIDVARLLDGYVMTNRVSAFPLVDSSGRPTGLVTLARVKQVAADRRASTLTRDIACPIAEIATARPTEPLMSLLERLATCTEGRGLVLDDEGRLLGIVTATDVTRTVERAALLKG